MTMATDSPLLNALAAHKVSATVVDLDHYRIQGGLAVETDYIISVECTDTDADQSVSFETFRISKTYSSFRSLSSQLKKSAEKQCAQKNGAIPPDLGKAIGFTESLNHLVDSQPTEYLGKLDYDYVKKQAKLRSEILNDALEMVTQNYPTGMNEDDDLKEMSDAIENFFLTDYCEEEDAPSTPPRGSITSTPAKRHTSTKKHRKKASGAFGFFGGDKKEKEKEKEAEKKDKEVTFASPVVPRTTKSRRSLVVRTADEEMLQASSKSIGDVSGDTGASSAKPGPSPTMTAAPPHSVPLFGGFFANNPYAAVVVVAVVLGVLRRAQFIKVTMDSDVAMLVSFACFCFGLNWPRPASVIIQQPPPGKKPAARRRTSVAPTTGAAGPTARQLLRSSMMASPTGATSMMESMRSVQKWDAAGQMEEEEEEEPVLGSPMETYPQGAELGEYFNCVSEPDCTDFHVRGPNYFKDKVKIPSGPFLFPIRGVDLFLTDDPPENVGRNSGCMGGRLRDVPTFLVNFRLPWGVLVFYAEIPDRFLPFMRSCYDPFFDEKLPSLDDMDPGDRTLARFLMGDDDYKNKRLKIVPVIVKGPWIVQSVAGGKPAIVGTKMPLNYVYGPKVGNKAEYLEADLDVVASAVARKICSVVVNYTQGVTIDLGFVIEGQADDELPEQMLLASRLHGIDPIHAPALPPMKDMYMIDDTPTLSTD